MASRHLRQLVPALLAAARGTSSCAGVCGRALAISAPATAIGSLAGLNIRNIQFSALALGADPNYPEIQNYEPPRTFGRLDDKELWHEAWMYEVKQGTEEDPIVVPSLDSERIIGVTDPEDDNLVVWGWLRANEPPRQFIEGGEYFVLKVVPYIMKVGDVLDQLEAKAAEAAPAGEAAPSTLDK